MQYLQQNRNSRTLQKEFPDFAKWAFDKVGR